MQQCLVDQPVMSAVELWHRSMTAAVCSNVTPHCNCAATFVIIIMNTIRIIQLLPHLQPPSLMRTATVYQAPSAVLCPV